ncbi:right-handed parallel beta-helix repeat-containing protein [Actinomycetospora sp. C-140]
MTGGLSRRTLLAGAGALATTGALAAVGATAACATAAPRPPVVAPPMPSGSALRRGPVVDVRDHGARGDGTTDDTVAVRDALNDANGQRGTLYFPAGVYRYRVAEALAPAAGVVVAGEPGRSTLRLEAPSADAFVVFCAPVAAGVTLDGLVLERAADFPCVFVALGLTDDLTLSRMAFIGHQDRWPAHACHGVQLGARDGATSRGLRWTDSVVMSMNYGLLQTNASTGRTDDVAVTRCRFVGNAETDLEFNSPKGATSGVLVEGCEFRDPLARGFALGVATGRDVTIRGNTMSGYALEAVHVEDYSDGVTIVGNRVASAGLEGNSHIQLIGGARRITVERNTFLAGSNTSEIVVVNALAGGTAPTPGGRPTGPPADVVVADNDFELAETVRAASFEGVTGGAFRGNRLRGPALDDDPGAAVGVTGSTGIDVSANTANGRPF